MRQLNMEICSICKKEFKTEKAYLDHICLTGFKPSSIDHQIKLNPSYKNISELALKRGK